MERFVLKTVGGREFDQLLRYTYGGSLKRFLEANDMSSLEDFLDEFGGDEEKARQWLWEMVSDQVREMEESMEEDRKRLEREEEENRIHRIWIEQVQPLRDRAVEYARRMPDVYSIRENVSSTYIQGPSGTIRFSDHPQKVDYDNRGRSVVRGGWAKGSHIWSGDYYPSADYSVDPSNAGRFSWSDVLSWLKDIAKEEQE
jgi:hypothetical protein